MGFEKRYFKKVLTIYDKSLVSVEGQLWSQFVAAGWLVQQRSYNFIHDSQHILFNIVLLP